jgi:hypothetical protein
LKIKHWWFRIWLIHLSIVIPANHGSGSGAGPGIQSFKQHLNSGFRRSDGIVTFSETINIKSSAQKFQTIFSKIQDERRTTPWRGWMFSLFNLFDVSLLIQALEEQDTLI